jgi:phage FluMu protein Com
MLRNVMTSEGKVTARSYHCEECGAVLFEGHIPAAKVPFYGPRFIELKICPRCKHMNEVRIST